MFLPLSKSFGRRQYSALTGLWSRIRESMQRKTEEALAKKAQQSNAPAHQQEPPAPKDKRLKQLHSRFSASKPTLVNAPSPFGASPWSMVMPQKQNKLSPAQEVSLHLKAVSSGWRRQCSG